MIKMRTKLFVMMWYIFKRSECLCCAKKNVLSLFLMLLAETTLYRLQWHRSLNRFYTSCHQTLSPLYSAVRFCFYHFSIHLIFSHSRLFTICLHDSSSQCPINALFLYFVLFHFCARRSSCFCAILFPKLRCKLRNLVSLHCCIYFTLLFCQDYSFTKRKNTELFHFSPWKISIFVFSLLTSHLLFVLLLLLNILCYYYASLLGVHIIRMRQLHTWIWATILYFSSISQWQQKISFSTSFKVITIQCFSIQVFF